MNRVQQGLHPRPSEQRDVSHPSPSGRRRRWIPAVVISYAVLAALLLLTRLVGLGHSLWHDEIFAAVHYIDRGTVHILSGPGISHQLFSVLASASRPILGDSEIAFRMWSVIPFVLGVAVVTVWLHRRVGALSGLLFLYLATVSPLLLDITRQARGYGLAFFAMAILIVSALEAVRGGGAWPIVALVIAGILGTWNLPQFGIAFSATAAVLLCDRRQRRRLAVVLALPIVVAGLWWGPHLNEVHAASQIRDGVQIHAPWVFTAPVDQTVIPALIWIDGTVVIAGVVWLPVILVALLLMSASPLARDRRELLVLVSGAVATILVLWLGHAYVIPRYLSFLLVPGFILLATGMATVLHHMRTRPMLLRNVATLVILAVLGFRFVSIAPDMIRLPREANRDAARMVQGLLPPSAKVLLYMHQPMDVVYYFGRPAEALETPNVASRVCSGREPLAFVTQPFVITPVKVPCLVRKGAKYYRIRQYARGKRIDVWIVPPA